MDIRSLDRLAGALNKPGGSPDEVFAELDFCLLARVTAPAKLDAALRKVARKNGATVKDDGTTVHLLWKGAGASDDLGLSYSIHRGVLALSPANTTEIPGGRVQAFGHRITDGKDFRTVFSHLDPNPSHWLYLNLPRLRQLLLSSSVIARGLSSEPETRSLYERYATPSQIPTGLGVTVVEVDHGVRQTTYGPKLFSSLGMGKIYPLILGAIAIPNLLNATNRGWQNRTMMDIRTIGIAIEEYNVDYGSYPSTGGAWVNAAELAPKLSSTYLKNLPRTDAWGHPFRVWSDVQSYIIVSPADNGTIDRDWLGQSAPEPSTKFAADIVFKDGTFLQWPESLLTD
ncbi:MAG: hypothetical protein GXP47_05130 [Acidobacteria bacterium]|nr:hypothetical protein [Acidobacteriota bacterium]